MPNILQVSGDEPLEKEEVKSAIKAELTKIGLPNGGGPFVCGRLIPCASHVPARCRGETKSRSKCQSVRSASLRALCDEMRGVAKATSKEFRKSLKTQSETSPNPLKSRPGTVLGAEMQPCSSTEQPRDSQERPRSAQETPKKGQERPEAAQERTKVG